MRNPIVEILTIGREILDGRVVDTNSVYLGEQLARVGLVPRYAQRVDDDIGRILEAFAIADKRSQIILVTGGLGPTADDLTAEAFSRYLQKPLLLHAEALANVEAFFARVGAPLTEVQRKQALLPSPCTVLSNPVGSAPGFSFRRSHDRQLWFFFPGVPREMKHIFENEVLPQLPVEKNYRSYSWATQFTSEGELQERLNPVHEQLPADFEISYRTRFPENHIGLHGVCRSPTEQKQFDELVKKISALLGSDVFSQGEKLKSLEEVVLDIARTKNLRLACVESCTGGLVSSRLTDISGSSSHFWSSWVCYDNAAKIALGVDAELLRRHGAVSPEIAQALAERGLKKLQELGESSSPLLCLATTGIAGPTGGTEEKPVGLCYVALASSDASTVVERVQARPGRPRHDYKLYFSQKALDLVRKHANR